MRSAPFELGASFKGRIESRSIMAAPYQHLGHATARRRIDDHHAVIGAIRPCAYCAYALDCGVIC
ncbi:hypothetical protein [Paraburkholderia youngii]|uniref:hypothetical protein n=1 Tax=Paraburkholderia youngii TaxID=2782701 RepID=UPI003D1E053B